MLDPPLPPDNASVTTNNFTAHNFSIILSWTKSQRADNYIISVNTTTQAVSTEMTTLLLKGYYNIPLEITLIANCGGSSSEGLTLLVYEGIYMCYLYSPMNRVVLIFRVSSSRWKGMKLPPLTTKLPLLAASLSINFEVATPSETTRDHAPQPGTGSNISGGACPQTPLALESSSFQKLPPQLFVLDETLILYLTLCVLGYMLCCLL